MLVNVLVSACLLGEDCKYDGGNNYNEQVVAFLKAGDHHAVPVCPEVMGGLPTPRVPAEIADGIVTTRDGRDVDAAFRHGAAEALRVAQEHGVQLAILQPRSPSCGVKSVYDGTFSGNVIPGMGVCAALLREHGIPLVDAGDLELGNIDIL
jgi:uncharacterized protein YbbK (DUF523 family)